LETESGTLPASKFGPALAKHRGDGNALRRLVRCADADAGEVDMSAPQHPEKAIHAVLLE
jgi:hypothetical protein